MHLPALIKDLPKCTGPFQLSKDECVGKRSCGNPATHYIVNGADTRDGVCLEHMEEANDMSAHGVRSLSYGKSLTNLLDAM